MIRILLIEDDEHIAQSIQFFLEGEGFQIDVYKRQAYVSENTVFGNIVFDLL